MHEWGTTLISGAQVPHSWRSPLPSYCPAASLPSVCFFSFFIPRLPLVALGEKSLHSSHAAAEPTADWLTDWLLVRAGAGYTSSTWRGGSPVAMCLHIHEQSALSPPLSLSPRYQDNHTLHSARGTLWQCCDVLENNKPWPAVTLIIISHCKPQTKT